MTRRERISRSLLTMQTAEASSLVSGTRLDGLSLPGTQFAILFDFLSHLLINRNAIWQELINDGAFWLNADDLEAASSF